LYQKSIKKKR